MRKLIYVIVLFTIPIFGQIDKPIIGMLNNNFIKYTPSGNPNLQASTDVTIDSLSGNSIWINIGQYPANHPTDWHVLCSYLRAHPTLDLDVYIYLFSPTDGYSPWSRPFGRDYNAWVAAIADSSLVLPQLKGYTIDDFYLACVVPEGQDNILSPTAVETFVNIGKAINPNLKFYPCIYASAETPATLPGTWNNPIRNQLTTTFIDNYLPFVDGIMYTYPRDSMRVVQGAEVMNDTYLIFETKASSVASTQYSYITQTIPVTDPNNATITINYYNNTDRKQNHADFEKVRNKVLVNGVERFNSAYKHHELNTPPDTMACFDSTFTMNLSPYVGGNNSITVTLGLSGNVDYGGDVRARYQVISTTGLNYDRTKWTENKSGAFTSGIWVGDGLHPKPLIVFYAMSVAQYEKRRLNAATPANIVAQAKIGASMIVSGQIEGMANFDTPVNVGIAEQREIMNLAIPIYRQLAADLLGDTVGNLKVNLKIFLQGPFQNGSMTTALYDNELMPSSQPFNTSPWNYNGNESLSSGSSSSSYVDWVLIELRSSSNPTQVVARKAAILKNDGSLLNTDGSIGVPFSNLQEGSYYIALFHRNHLAVMSAAPIQLSANTPTYDFTSGMNKAYGQNPMKELAPGKFGMYASDGNSNGGITINDRNEVWAPQNGTMGYLQGDFNLDGGVTAGDVNLYWNINNGTMTQVP
jgi:hypothetical protein